MTFSAYVRLALTLVTGLISIPSIAQPSITNIEGSILEGANISISGSNFGAGSPQVLWDTVINQIEPTENVDGKVVPVGNGKTWKENGSQWSEPFVFSLDKTPQARRSLAYESKRRGTLRWPSEITDLGLDNIYITWWFWSNESPSANGGSNKFIRVWDESDGKHTRISWTQMHMTATAKDIDYNTGAAPSWGDWGGNAGKWNRMELWVSGDHNVIRAWTNNKLIHNITDFKKSTTSQGLNIYLLGFDPSVSEKYPNFEFKVSDIYASPTIARVEISNKATWNDINAIREIQPIQNWEDNKIGVTLNFGSFKNLSDKYLYIVDGNGNANKSGFSLCPSCPQSPALQIE
ncbi:hypothetical protein [Alkalimarinus alittae]|uniref:Uncharacterized protein n=1 Tax=Alkalimarinus alittae TaxID=2961619 RepID=A0ABY6N7I7_9ALTE|nr:hypothetical protein [Alkalimarinus alittae]UZE97974.1 hypothetical protein NKI27_09640 [Alkalimarinus alittae]